MGEEMTITDWVQAISTVVLVLVTVFYAWQTKKTVSEMKKQRYDTVRPVIDIQRQKPSEMEGTTRAKEILTTESNLENVGLSCILCNIGLGPAIDAHSFTPSPNEQSICYNYGVLAVGERTAPINLFVKQVRGRGFIVIYYKDVYGRNFESKREVINEDNNRWVLGSLISNPVEEV